MLIRGFYAFLQNDFASTHSKGNIRKISTVPSRGQMASGKKFHVPSFRERFSVQERGNSGFRVDISKNIY